MGHKPWNLPWRRQEKRQARRRWKADVESQAIDMLQCADGRHGWFADREGPVWCHCGEQLAQVTFTGGSYRIELVAEGQTPAAAVNAERPLSP